MDSPLFRVRELLRQGLVLSAPEIAQRLGLSQELIAAAIAHWQQRGKLKRVFSLALPPSAATRSTSPCQGGCRSCGLGSAPQAKRAAALFRWDEGSS